MINGRVRLTYFKCTEKILWSAPHGFIRPGFLNKHCIKWRGISKRRDCKERVVKKGKKMFCKISK